MSTQTSLFDGQTAKKPFNRPRSRDGQFRSYFNEELEIKRLKAVNAAKDRKISWLYLRIEELKRVIEILERNQK